MLHTIQAKTDATSPIPQTKQRDQDASPEAVNGEFRSFGTQFRAAMPLEVEPAPETQPLPSPGSQDLAHARATSRSQGRKSDPGARRPEDLAGRASAFTDPQASDLSPASRSGQRVPNDRRPQAADTSGAGSSEPLSGKAKAPQPSTRASQTPPSPDDAPPPIAASASGASPSEAVARKGQPSPSDAPENQTPPTLEGGLAQAAATAAWAAVASEAWASNGQPPQSDTRGGQAPPSPEDQDVTALPGLPPPTASTLAGAVQAQSTPQLPAAALPAAVADLAATAPAPASPPPPGGKSSTQSLASSKAQALLEELVPGLKVQFQFGLPEAVAPKPALSEFLNQLKVEMDAPNFNGVGSGPADPNAPLNPAALAAAAPFMALADPQMLTSAAQSALVTPKTALREGAPGSPSAPGKISPLDPLGAGLSPMAGSAVRIPPTVAPEAAQPQKRESPLSPMHQVESSIRWLIKNQERSAELQLHPESLGRVQVKLTLEGNQVHAKLWASESAALPVLHEQRAFLEASLKDQGLTLGSFDLQQGHPNQQDSLPQKEQFIDPPARPSPLANLGQETPAEDAAESAKPRGSHRIEIVA